MNYIIYLRSGKVVEITADDIKCVDQKNQIYKMFSKVDDVALNKHVVAIVNDPDAIICSLDITNNEND